jgi:ribosomal-protein-alanine N-acetyltransferase
MADIEIAPATWRDALALNRLDRRCFPPIDAYGWWTYVWLCVWPGVVALKAVKADALIGFVAGDPRRRSKYVVIVTIAVEPDWRGRGIGEQLLRACEARFDLPCFRLQVRKSNAPAIGLYRKLGYTIAGTLPRYYGDGEDAYLMQKVVE